MILYIIDELNKNTKLSDEINFSYVDEEGYINNEKVYKPKNNDFSKLTYYNYLTTTLNNNNNNYLLVLKLVLEQKGHTVIIDDEIVINGDEVPAFAYGKAWAIFLEKAWAKIHQTYKDSIRGEVFEILRDLTGAPSFQYDLTKDEGLSIEEIH